MESIQFIGNLIFNQSAKGHNYASVANGMLMGYTLTPEQSAALKTLRQSTDTNRAGRKMAKFGLVRMRLVQVDEMEELNEDGTTAYRPIYAMDGLPTRADDPSNTLFE